MSPVKKKIFENPCQNFAKNWACSCQKSMPLKIGMG